MAPVRPVAVHRVLEQARLGATPGQNQEQGASGQRSAPATYAAATLPAQLECPQPQAISVVSFAASQLGLQYLLPSDAMQLQSSWAHLFFLASVIFCLTLFGVRDFRVDLAPTSPAKNLMSGDT